MNGIRQGMQIEVSKILEPSASICRCPNSSVMISRPVHADIDERLDPKIGEDDPFGENNVLTGSRLDIADLAQQLLLSEMPMGLRCSDSCQGLCGTCGANKNTGECACSNTNGDSSGKSKVEDAAQ